MRLQKASYTILLVLALGNGYAQVKPPRITVDTTDAPPKKSILKAQNVGEMVNSKKFLLGKEVFSGDVSYNWGRILVDNETREVYKSALGFMLNIKPYKEFAFRTTLFYHFNKEARNFYTPDFQYAFGKFDWRPNVFNYGYENYSNNFYDDSLHVLAQKFFDGYYFVSYQHNLPAKWMSRIRLDKTSEFSLAYFIRYSVKYRDRMNVAHGGIFDGKPIFSATARWMIWKRIYIEGGVNQYVNPALQKMPWDPDYTYGFGYFDWRHLRVSLIYGNYSVNRFPWNEKEMKRYGFIDGSFSINLNWIW